MLAHNQETLVGYFGRYGDRLHQLARRIDQSPVVSKRPTKSISAEDTFERDILLADIDDLVRKLAEKVWSASRKDTRMVGTIVLKLKTSNFKSLTSSFTGPNPSVTWEELAAMALLLRDRVDATPTQRFRRVGVGLSNFVEEALRV